jgi:hypothetical protein
MKTAHNTRFSPSDTEQMMLSSSALRQPFDRIDILPCVPACEMTAYYKAKEPTIDRF